MTGSDQKKYDSTKEIQNEEKLTETTLNGVQVVLVPLIIHVLTKVYTIPVGRVEFKGYRHYVCFVGWSF